jgi:hypothetical protein
MTIEAEQDVIGLTKVGRVVALALRTMQDGVRPGMTTFCCICKKQTRLGRAFWRVFEAL